MTYWEIFLTIILIIICMQMVTDKSLDRYMEPHKLRLITIDFIIFFTDILIFLRTVYIHLKLIVKRMIDGRI